MIPRLYARQPLTGADLKQCAPDAEVGGEGTDLWVRWEDLSITARAMPRQALPGHLAGMRTLMGEQGAPLEIVDRLCAAQDVVLVEVDPGPDAGGRFETVLRRLASQLDALVLRGFEVIDFAGQLLFTALKPPEPARVVRRALALSALVHRGYVDQFPAAAFQDAHHDALAWIRQHQLEDEFEEHERRTVRAGQGEASQQDIINATWRAEGLAIISWALGAVEQLPPHDLQVHPKEISGSLGFLHSQLPEAAVQPALRDRQQLEAAARRLLGIHWRFREFAARPAPLDMAAFAVHNWFGGFEIDQVQLAEGDLAIDGTPIFRAAPGEVGRCHSIAVERDLAIRWLLGFDPVYSQVDLST